MANYSYATSNDQAQARTNITLFVADVQSLYRKYVTDLKIENGLAGSRRNGGIVVNYRLPSPPKPNYVVALLNVDSSAFGIYFFNGMSLVSLGSVHVPDARVDEWYRMEFSAVPTMPSLTSITLAATLRNLTSPDGTYSINTSLPSRFWGDDAANAGFYADRSKTVFSYWRIEEAV